jgi:ribosomal protein L22
MSAEDEQETPEETPAKTGKPAAARKAASEKKAAEKPAAKKPASKEPSAKQPAAEKPASGKPAGKKAPVDKDASINEEAANEADEDGLDAESPAELATPKSHEDAARVRRRRVVRARARYVRTSARKARMVSGHLRGKTVEEARAILAFTPREVARDWSKLLESAVANAENNHELLEDDLVVREAYADEGPTIKRFRPRALGRATPIHKRTSHLTITLTPGA